MQLARQDGQYLILPLNDFFLRFMVAEAKTAATDQNEFEIIQPPPAPYRQHAGQ